MFDTSRLPRGVSRPHQFKRSGAKQTGTRASQRKPRNRVAMDYVDQGQAHSSRWDHRTLTLKPARWSRNTRNWTPINSVTLNPERDSVVNAHTAHVNIEPLAA